MSHQITVYGHQAIQPATTICATLFSLLTLLYDPAQGEWDAGQPLIPWVGAEHSTTGPPQPTHTNKDHKI